MNRKTLIWIGLAVGSTIGSMLPFLWDSSAFFSSILFGAVGGIAGIWLGFRVAG